MANVLTPQSKRSVWRVQRARFVTVFSLAIFGLAAVASAALVPSYIALEIASPQIIEVPESGRSESADPVAVTRAHTLVRELSAVITATTSPSMLYTRALEARPQGLAVDSVTYSRADGRITISGAGARELISAYRNTLSTDPLFASVSVPVGALVGSDGGRFSITITTN